MIHITSKGVPELIAWLKEIERGSKTVASEAVAEYLVGDQSHGLMHYTPYKHITIAQAGGWRSEKQRRFVMAQIREGNIDPGFPHRTGEMQRSWKYRMDNKSTRWTITNETSYSGWVMGDNTQSNMHGLIGWRTVSRVVADNIRGAYRHATAKVKAWLKNKRPKSWR